METDMDMDKLLTEFNEDTYDKEYYILADGEKGYIVGAKMYKGNVVLEVEDDEEGTNIILDDQTGVLIDGNKFPELVKELVADLSRVDIEPYRIPVDLRPDPWGDCLSNIDVFCSYLTQDKYPSKVKIPPNVCPEEMIGGIDHQFIAFKENVKRAYDWKLIQGTVIHGMDLLPMAHCWCEATLDDIGGLWQRHSTLSGRFVFDFTKTKGQLFFQSVRQFNIIRNIPPEKHELAWDGNEKHYHRFEYNPEEAKAIVHKPENFGDYKFYEFDSGAINAELRNI